VSELPDKKSAPQDQSQSSRESTFDISIRHTTAYLSMSNQVSGITGGLTDTAAVLQGKLSNLINIGQGSLDKVFPHEQRKAWKAWLAGFATERPYLTSFLLSQIIISGLPLVLFAITTVAVFVFALIAGVLVGVLGALLFVGFTVGVALLILLPTLFFTTTAAVFVWLWGVSISFIIKWFYTDVAGVSGELPLGGSPREPVQGHQATEQSGKTEKHEKEDDDDRKKVIW